MCKYGTLKETRIWRELIFFSEGWLTNKLLPVAQVPESSTYDDVIMV